MVNQLEDSYDGPSTRTLNLRMISSGWGRFLRNRSSDLIAMASQRFLSLVFEALLIKPSAQSTLLHPPVFEDGPGPFVRLPEGPNPDLLHTELREKPSDKSFTRLRWALATIWDEQKTHLLTLPAVMDEVERIVHNDPQARELLTPRVRSLLSDLSVMAECQQQIALFQPWASTFETEMAQYNQELEDEYVERMSFLTTLDAAVESTNWAMLGDPSKNKFRYPIDKRRTPETTATLQEAERALELFWRKADTQLLHVNDTSPEALKKLLRSGRTLYRTPGWVEPSTTKTDRNQRDELEDLTQPLSEIYYDLQKRTEKTVTPSEQAREKMKKKTRGEAKTPSGLDKGDRFPRHLFRKLITSRPSMRINAPSRHSTHSSSALREPLNQARYPGTTSCTP